MVGKGSKFYNQCYKDGFIGVDYEVYVDLKNELTDDWKEFNHFFIPKFMEILPEKSKIAAGLAGGATHTVCKGIKQGDIVLVPDGNGNYSVCEVTGPYEYHHGEILPHRRPVVWHKFIIPRDEMSESLRHSTGSAGTVSDISGYADEIEAFLGGGEQIKLISTDETIEDPSYFAMEKHLEEFLIANWTRTPLGKDYEIFCEEGEKVGQQYPTDTGNIDILAVSKDKNLLLVVELKKGRASDAVVGQILRYMGYVQDELAIPGQAVKGVIIAMEDDQRLKRALSMMPSIEFYRYEVSFKLQKA